MKARFRLWLLTALLSPPLSTQAADDWLPVRETSMVLGRTSPLDFSKVVPNWSINSDRRLITGKAGYLVRSDDPITPVRMLCASLAWSPASGGFPNHADADVYAAELAKHGYNIARLHFIDASLMTGRERDLDFDPQTLDRVHYLLAALKRNGIYWIIDGLSSWRGAYGGYDDRWDPSSDLKLALNLDDVAFNHWLKFQRKFLTAINPYTGIAPIHDEALALMILVNENGIEFDSVVREREGKPHYDARLKPLFNDWLRAKYATTAALSQVWPDLDARERLETASVELPQSRYHDSPRHRDLQAFFVSIEQASVERMTKALRDLGYRGEISNFNNWPTLQTALSRADLPVITMNTYQDWVGSYLAGATLTQQSSIADGANYMRMIAAARWMGRPFAVSEYDHLFWNRYRYEAGLVMPAYAALQRWDILCRHGHGPIILRYGEPFPHKQSMLPYAIALDPVARAGETLAALLYRRGDVAGSSLSIPFLVHGTEDLTNDMQAREPEALTELALVSAIGLRQAGSQVPPDGLTIDQPRTSADPQAVLDQARSEGRLAEGNRTDLQLGLYESDTSEILLDRRRGQLRVSTPKTEAAAFSTLAEPVDLGTVTIEASDGNGLLSFSAIDDAKSLQQSRRILVVYATDARNTGMRFSDDEDRTIADFGRLPVLIRKGYVEVSMNLMEGQWTLTPIGLDGTLYRTELRSIMPSRLQISNDTRFGPTTFFLLEHAG